MDITFNQLPEAVATLLSKLESLEQRISHLFSVPSKEDKPLNAGETSAFLGIPKNTLYALTSRREIPFCKKGKHLFFFKDELIAWLQSGRQQTLAEIKAGVEKSIGLRKGRLTC